MNSNRKVDVPLDGTLSSHTTNLNAFVLGPEPIYMRVGYVFELRFSAEKV